MSGNSATGAGLGIGAKGGGIYTTAETTLTNSIVVGNVIRTEVDEIFAGLVIDNGANIVGADASAFDASTFANIINADPTQVFALTQANSANSSVLVGTLADNGGATQTIALAADFFNPALDAGVDLSLIHI